METFASRMKELRKEQKMTQEELAEKLGISRSAVGMYEQGRREPDFEMLDLAAYIFDVSIGYMVGNKERGIYPRHDEQPEERKPRHIGVTLEEERLIKAFRATNDDVKKAVMAVLRIKA